MKTLPDKSVDCFVCDLPYGCLAIQGNTSKITHTKKNRDMKDGENGCSWDVKIDLVQFWTQVKRLCKSENTPVLMFCNTRFGIDLINSNPKWFRYDLVWNKNRGVSFLDVNKQPMKSHEMIYVFSKKGSYYKRIDEIKSESVKCSLSVLNINRDKKLIGHPTAKPMALYRWLLSRYCPDGGTVLDPTAGSFNSIMVAEELGCIGIGIEMDEAFFSSAVERHAEKMSLLDI